jgi:Ca2+/H+ antiporter, TMEM165/GDT1 family
VAGSKVRAFPGQNRKRTPSVHPLVILIVFGVIAIAELPDKSLFASLVLGTRYRTSWVFAGVAAAFLVHVVIAVAAGGLLTLLPRRAVEVIVAALFAAGSLVLLLGREDQEVSEGVDHGVDATRNLATNAAMHRVMLTSFGVVFVGEWGDITQIATANYAARYHDPVSVGIGATLALWAVTALAITAGKKILDYVSVKVVRRVTGLILACFAALSTWSAIIR